jgi:NMD protein affecting ribosome stability and mRNA decay
MRTDICGTCFEKDGAPSVRCAQPKCVVKETHTETVGDGKEIAKCEKCRLIPDPGPRKAWSQMEKDMKVIEKRR